MPGFAKIITELLSSIGEPTGDGVVELSFGAAESGSLAYTHGDFLLMHREHSGVCRSHASLDLAQASQDRRSVLRIVCIGRHDSGV